MLLAVGLVAGSGWLLRMGWSQDDTDSALMQAKAGELKLAARGLYLARQNGVPPEEPWALLQGDAKIRRPRLLAEQCAGCHTWNGEDGLGKVALEEVKGERRPVLGTVPGLAGCGSRDWILRFFNDRAVPSFLGQADQIPGGISPGLDLNGCGSTKWLAEFVRNLCEKRFYGKKDVMPAVDAERLPDRNVWMLIEWMRGEWQDGWGGERPTIAP